MEKLKWYLRQLLPLFYWTEYRDMEGNVYVSVWQMWLGKVFNHKCWQVVK